MNSEQTSVEEAQFRLLFEASPNPYLILRPDRNFTVVAVNERYLAATGTNRADILGRGLFEVFPDNPDDQSGSGVSDLRTSLERVLRDKARDLMGVQKYDIPRRDGEGFEVKYWSPENTPVFAPDGSIAFIIHHVEDITDFVLMRERASQESAEKLEQVSERAQKMEAEVMRRATEVKDANRQIKAAMEKVEAANRAKSIFLANMSHELRTPLNAILGFCRLMRNAKDATTEQMQKLDIIARSGEYLLNLINNILDISKIESGHVSLEEGDLDLHHLLHETQSMMHVRAVEKGLSFAMVLARDFPRYVSVDAGKLRQILINLIGNAVKFTRSGGIILRARISSRDSPQRVRVRFEVEDSGPGIRAEDRERIFSPFKQLGNQPRSGEGTGLGLSICKQYAELMGGQIGVRTEPGKGSVFQFEIPLSITRPTVEISDRSPSRVTGLAQGQPRYRLLVAEDQPDNRQLLHLLLEPLGFDIREAVNGREAVTLFEQWHPHLIWMDIRMPEMDGMQATRKIKASEAGAQTKIVALTAHALEDERNEILAAGCDDFIRKPYQDVEIFEALERNLGVRFAYAEEHSPAAAGEAGAVSLAQLERLPSDLLRDLRDAAVLLDGPRCLAIAGRIDADESELRGRLQHMVTELQYTELLQVLDNAIAMRPA